MLITKLPAVFLLKYVLTISLENLMQVLMSGDFVFKLVVHWRTQVWRYLMCMDVKIIPVLTENKPGTYNMENISKRLSFLELKIVSALNCAY